MTPGRLCRFGVGESLEVGAALALSENVRVDSEHSPRIVSEIFGDLMGRSAEA